MAVTVKTVKCTEMDTYDINGIKYFNKPCDVEIGYLHNGEKHTIVFHFMEGFACDGLSVPKLLRKWWPNWDPKNPIYNASGAVHDFLYCTKGLYGHFTRSEADDFLRGIIRESGKKRFIASAADWAVGLFAGTKSHWGADQLDVRFLCIVEVDPV